MQELSRNKECGLLGSGEENPISGGYHCLRTLVGNHFLIQLDI